MDEDDQHSLECNSLLRFKARDKADPSNMSDLIDKHGNSSTNYRIN